MSVSAIHPAFQPKITINYRKNDNQPQQLSAPQKASMNPSFGLSKGTAIISLLLLLVALSPLAIYLFNPTTGNP